MLMMLVILMNENEADYTDEIDIAEAGAILTSMTHMASASSSSAATAAVAVTDAVQNLLLLRPNHLVLLPPTHMPPS